MRKVRLSQRTLLLFLLLLIIVLMGIGYSAINSVTGEIKGIVIANIQNGVFISNVEYSSDVNADLENSTIKYYKGTYLQNTVKLSDTNASSSITYKVTFYNNSSNSYVFVGVEYDEEFYDNVDIIYETSGFDIGQSIDKNEVKEIYVTFKYKDENIPENKILNSNLNFKLEKINRMMMSDSKLYGYYLRGTIDKSKIEKISFIKGTTAPEKTLYKFDASENEDNSIIGYYTDTDGNELYELTFMSEGTILPNINASCLFKGLSSLNQIIFDNFDVNSISRVTTMNSMFYYCMSLTDLDLSGFNTNQVTDMGSMFYYCRNLTSLDLSGFNTEQVADMSGMFYVCSSLTNLELSSFNTEQVTDMDNMFAYCSGLTNLDLSNFNTTKVTTMNSMFKGCSNLTDLNVSKFDTSQVTDMSYMFGDEAYGGDENANSLTNLDISNFNTSQVTGMGLMFYNCRGLTNIDLSNFDTSRVIGMGSMFYNCGNLTNLDLNKFNTSNVKKNE